MIPLVQISTSLGLYGSIQGIVLVHVIYGIPITTLIFRNYYAGIPTEVIEAARVDGAGFGRIYTSILLPISATGFLVVLIWMAGALIAALPTLLVFIFLGRFFVRGLLAGSLKG